MPTFHVTIAVAQRPTTDDDADQLPEHPDGWVIARRSGGWGNGFRLELVGDADDERDAEQLAEQDTADWLIRHDIGGQVVPAKARVRLATQGERRQWPPTPRRRNPNRSPRG